MRKFFISLGVFLGFIAIMYGGATFSRVKTWSAGEVLTAADLNAEFNNILNNLDPDGIDDYSSDTTEMRSTTDPYPASSESQATALAGEIERLRYQILEIKKTLQASNITYWYEDLPTAGVFTIAGSSVGVNDTTPSFSVDITGTLNATDATTLGGTLTVSSDTTLSGTLDVTGVTTLSSATVSNTLTVSTLSVTSLGGTKIKGYFSGLYSTETFLAFDSESFDTLNEFDTASSSVTIANDGYYDIRFNVLVSFDTTIPAFAIQKNDVDIAKAGFNGTINTGAAFPVMMSVIEFCEAGDVIDFYGVSYNQIAGGEDDSYFTITRVF